MRKLKISIVLFLSLLLLISVFLRWRYGGGEYYPDLTTKPLLSESKLEAFFSYNEPLGNIAVSSENRIFFTVHPESRPTGNKLLEIVNGQALPFPSTEFQDNFTTVLGVMIDKNNQLWTIDHGNHGLQDVRVMAFDLNVNKKVYDHVFPSKIAGIGSFFNDLQVDKNGIIYIADQSFFGKSPAIVVHNSKTGESKRVLENHPSVTSQDWIIKVGKQEMTFLAGLVAFKPGVDGIVLSGAEDYIYYGAMSHDQLYRINTKAMNNFSLSHSHLESLVEVVGKKPLNDGLTIDELNNVFITDVEHNSIMRLSPNGNLQTIIQSKRIRWADGASFGEDGYLYFTDSALPDVVLKSKTRMKAAAPFHIYRFNPGTRGVAGR